MSGIELVEGFEWSPVLEVEQFDPDMVRYTYERTGAMNPSKEQLRAYCKPGVVIAHGNLLTTAGLQRITRCITNSSSPTFMTNTTTRLGVGNGSTAATIADTDLSASSGSSNRWFNIMDASNPSTSGGVITAVSTFASGDGNFAWSEWGFDIGTATVVSGSTVAVLLLNRKVQAMGTKVSGSVWVATATMTFS